MATTPTKAQPKKAPAKKAAPVKAAAVKATPAKAPVKKVAAKPVAPKVPVVKLGTPVEYMSTSGKPKLALVLGTPKTVIDGTRIPVLTPGQLHLMVFNLNGSANARYNVPFAGAVAGNSDFTSGGKPAGVWRLTTS